MESLAKTSTPTKTEIKNVPFIDLKRQYFQLKEEILSSIDKTLSSGGYILGDTVEEFEKNAATYLECKYVLSVANGTDAIILSLKALEIGVGDEVILPTNSFVATAGAVIAVGARPVLCDVSDDLNIDVIKLESLITKKTKAIIPVHLTGRPAKMDKIMEIANHHQLAVIEDAAQSIGARFKGKMTGAIGHLGCFSLHPLKNLHVYGDGGLVSTNDEKLYSEIKLMRHHGLINRDTCVRWGLNSRLDAVQAGVANIGLAHLDRWNNQRRHTASRYQQALKDVVQVPQDTSDEHSVYHNFVFFTDKRDELMEFLLKNGIESKIHYPIPIHLQPAAHALGYQLGDFPVAEKQTQIMMSLPIYSELQENEVNYVIDTILRFFKG